MKKKIDLRDILVVAPSLHWHYSGVTSTIMALVPHQAQHLPIATLGPFMPETIPQLSAKEIFKHGWSKPTGQSYRIWHARRNNEMIVGLFLKMILRQPWKIVFTWAGQRQQAKLTQWLVRKMDAVIATSEAAASYLKVPATVIHHGVDTNKYHPTTLADQKTEWHKAGLPGDFGIGAFGRVRPEKGSDLFVKAMIQLLPKYPHTTSIITGLIATEFQAFASNLKKLTISAGLEKRIIFLGEKPVNEMPEWFRRISLYVAPMRWEGFGLTPLEAMASGVAVVATRTGVAADLVEDGVTGILVPPDDLEALINAIELLLANPEKCKAMGDAGREKAIHSHSIAKEVSAIQNVYEQIWK